MSLVSTISHLIKNQKTLKRSFSLSQDENVEPFRLQNAISIEAHRHLLSGKLVSRRIKVRIGFLRYLLIIKLSLLPITQAIVKFVVGSWGSIAHFQRNPMP